MSHKFSFLTESNLTWTLASQLETQFDPHWHLNLKRVRKPHQQPLQFENLVDQLCRPEPDLAQAGQDRAEDEDQPVGRIIQFFGGRLAERLEKILQCGNLFRLHQM